MKEIDFLDAVGRVNHKYIEECITYKPPKKMNVWVKRMSAIAACFLVIIAAVLITDHINKPVIIDENGFYIENGVLLRYTGSETDVTIPEEVETIADFTFLENTNRTKIEVVRLGASVQKVETNAFAGLENLVDIIIAANNLSFVEEDGLLMTSDKSILLQYKRQGETSFTIPESVRFVAAHAVQGTELEEIDFGENLEFIGYYAFSSNGKLKAIHLPDSVKYIGDGAFSDCRSAVDGSIPEHAELGIDAFRCVPFYNSMLAGQMSPGEEIVRGLITPSEAIQKSDLYSLTEQLTYVLASLRGDNDYEPSEAAKFGYAAVHDLAEIPEDMTVPETFSMEDISFVDYGWGGIGGLYDLQIHIPAGDYTILIESYGYDPFDELYWSETRFRLVKLYYVKNDISADEDTVVSDNGWTAVLEKEGEYYKDITFIHESGKIVRYNLGYLSRIPYTFTYSPDSTRVIAEYQHSESYAYRFVIISLNEDDIDVDYMDRYFGEYKPGTVKWLDNDNIEGMNQFGRFTMNVWGLLPVQFADAPCMTDPNNTNVKEVTHNTIGYNLTLNIPEIWFYEQVWLNEHYYDGVRIANQKPDIRARFLEEDKYYGDMLDGKTEEDWLENPHGTEYLIHIEYYSEPVKVYNILFRYKGKVIGDFVVNQFKNDSEDYFETVVQPLIDSAVVVPDESYTEPKDDSLCYSIEVNALPGPAEDARITSKLMGGSPLIYVFEDDMRFYLAYLNGKLEISLVYDCMLSLPDGYTNGRIIDAGGRGGSGEFCIYVSAKTGDQTVVLGYLFASGEGTPQPHEIIVDNEYTAYFDSANEWIRWLYDTGNADAFPSSPYTITITGFETPVVFEMDGYAKPASITAYDQTLPITEDAWLYGNYTFNLFEAEGAVVFSFGYYNIGHTYILTKDSTQIISPGTDNSIHLYPDDAGNLRYQRINNRIADIIQTGGLSAATSYDDLLYCYGDASIVDGKLVLEDVDEYYNISDKYDLDQEFENMYSRYHASIQEVFDSHTLYPGGAIYRPTVFEILLTMTVADIRSTYGELKLEYSEHGPGQPVYSTKYLPGVLLVFHNWNMDDPLTDDMIPAELILTEDCSRAVRGITVGANIEDRTQTIHWSDLWYHVINGTANLQAEFSGYTVTYTISGENLNLPAEDTAHEYDWDAWEAEYIQNPTGRVIEIRVKLNK